MANDRWQRSRCQVQLPAQQVFAQTAANARRVVMREAAVGLINGVFFALIMGAVGYLAYESWALGAVIGAAMIINLIVAALAGVMVPLTLERAGLDPAVAERLLPTDADIEALTAREAHARERGISAVPTFILDNAHAISGAQPVALWREVLADLSALTQGEGTSES